MYQHSLDRSLPHRHFMDLLQKIPESTRLPTSCLEEDFLEHNHSRDSGVFNWTTPWLNDENGLIVNRWRRVDRVLHYNRHLNHTYRRTRRDDPHLPAL